MDKEHREMLLCALKTHGACTVTLEGTSMWPFIFTGDRAVIAACRTRLRPGMVIAFFNEDQLVVHRIASTKTGPCGDAEIWTHGDAMRHSTCKIQGRDVIGVVNESMRNGKRHTFWFTPAGGALSLAISPAVRILLRIRRLIGVRRSH